MLQAYTSGKSLSIDCNMACNNVAMETSNAWQHCTLKGGRVSFYALLSNSCLWTLLFVVKLELQAGRLLAKTRKK